MTILVGNKAPIIDSNECFSIINHKGLIINNFQFQHVKNKYIVLFFYPLDFTFVCPSELIAIEHRITEFKKRNVEIFGISIDSVFTHNAWRNTPINKGGIGKISYTLISDIKHTLCKSYAIESSNNIALRGTFLIDKKGILKHQTVNDITIGRNIDETIRIIDSLQFFETHGDVCPAGWSQGKKGIKPTTIGISNYLTQNAQEL